MSVCQLLYTIAITLLAVSQTAMCSMNGRKVVLMSMDGFRYDYFSKSPNLTNFKAMKASGVSVPYVNNTFITKTFPSHYSIVTGLYEESHGIIENSMYDPVFNASFTMTTTEERWWDGGEPIWTNAARSGLKVGTFFWPGSEVKLKGYRPTSWMPYNGNVDYKTRVDTVVDDWLVRDDYDFGVIYFEEPDKSGHKYGPEAPEMIPALERMDNILGYFMQRLEATNLKDKVDFILTSDHGMTSVDGSNRVIILTDYINDTLVDTIVRDGPMASIIPKPGKDQDVVDALKGIDHLHVYLKKDIPDHFHYKNNRRITPVVAMADEGWLVLRRRYNYRNKGTHGFSNECMSMKPIFMATGPSFKKGVVGDPILNLDIYPLLCHLLHLEPAPNNGSFARVQGLLRSANNAASPKPLSVIWAAILFFSYHFLN